MRTFILAAIFAALRALADPTASEQLRSNITSWSSCVQFYSGDYPSSFGVSGTCSYQEHVKPGHVPRDGIHYSNWTTLSPARNAMIQELSKVENYNVDGRLPALDKVIVEKEFKDTENRYYFPGGLPQKFSLFAIPDCSQLLDEEKVRTCTKEHIHDAALAFIAKEDREEFCINSSDTDCILFKKGLALSQDLNITSELTWNQNHCPEIIPLQSLIDSTKEPEKIAETEELNTGYLFGNLASIKKGMEDSCKEYENLGCENREDSFQLLLRSVVKKSAQKDDDDLTDYAHGDAGYFLAQPVHEIQKIKNDSYFKDCVKMTGHENRKKDIEAISFLSAGTLCKNLKEKRKNENEEKHKQIFLQSLDEAATHCKEYDLSKCPAEGSQVVNNVLIAPSSLDFTNMPTQFEYIARLDKDQGQHLPEEIDHSTCLRFFEKTSDDATDTKMHFLRMDTACHKKEQESDATTILNIKGKCTEYKKLGCTNSSIDQSWTGPYFFGESRGLINIADKDLGLNSENSYFKNCLVLSRHVSANATSGKAMNIFADAGLVCKDVDDESLVQSRIAAAAEIEKHCPDYIAKGCLNYNIADLPSNATIDAATGTVTIQSKNATEQALTLEEIAFSGCLLSYSTKMDDTGITQSFVNAGPVCNSSIIEAADTPIKSSVKTMQTKCAQYNALNCQKRLEDFKSYIFSVINMQNGIEFYGNLFKVHLKPENLGLLTANKTFQECAEIAYQTVGDDEGNLIVYYVTSEGACSLKGSIMNLQ